MKRILLYLALLLALPFGLKACDSILWDSVFVVGDSLMVWGDDTIRFTPPGDFTLPAIQLPDSTPTYVVYRVDTVGWEGRWDKFKICPPNEGCSFYLGGGGCIEDHGYWDSTCVAVPTLDITIIHRFTTDADATDIKKWRVKSE